MNEIQQMAPVAAAGVGAMKRFELICGNAVAEMQKMPSSSVDVVITSPPYNLGESRGSFSAGGMFRYSNPAIARGYEGCDDALPYPQYIQWQHHVLRECWRLLTPQGVIFYNHKPRVVNGEVRLPTVLNPDLPLRQIVIWDRGTIVNFNQSFYGPCCEWIFVFAKPDFRLSSRAASAVGDVWRIAPELNTPHPAPFPLELPMRALCSLSDSYRTVLDPFCGSGTTGVAAMKTARQFIGIDTSPKYLEIAQKRIEAAAAQGSLFEVEA